MRAIDVMRARNARMHTADSVAHGTTNFALRPDAVVIAAHDGERYRTVHLGLATVTDNVNDVVNTFPPLTGCGHVPNIYIPGSTLSPCGGDSTPLWDETKHASCSAYELTNSVIGTPSLSGNKHATQAACRAACAAAAGCVAVHYRPRDGACELMGAADEVDELGDADAGGGALHTLLSL